ncbi:DUF3822 family protein [Terrimonas pollutisoli]|uniref:DUF3822 family protein n=1 Tax=Terrimonas pollutisoli TaxID=3034147 RepID=UPI0023ED55E3|nr:DUF3822 family protein [Terrimonas sp. H1YJ31]
MKQVYHIISEKRAEAAQQVLSIRVGERHFGFAITSPHAGELYKLSWYTDTEINKATLDEIYMKHPELHHTYQNTFICYDYLQSIMVPMDQYDKDDAKLMLQTMFGISGKDAIVNEPVSGWQMHNVYAVPKEVYDWACEHFKTGNYWHAYTIGIKNIITTDFEGSLAADFRTDDFSLVVTKGNKLLLTQTFPYSTPADFIYYLLDTCRQFSFSQETVRVYLSGLIDKESTLYKELHQYFLHIHFRETEWKISPAEELRYPAHFFTSLNDLAKCEL